MKTKEAPFNPELDAELTFTPAFQSAPFTITGPGETLQELAGSIEASMPPAMPMPAQKHTEAPQAAFKHETQYLDMAELSGREIARKRLTARLYDMVHRTNMYGLLNERINDDRNVRFARGLGILGVTHCAKHEKAVAKLKSLV